MRRVQFRHAPATPGQRKPCRTQETFGCLPQPSSPASGRGRWRVVRRDSAGRRAARGIRAARCRARGGAQRRDAQARAEDAFSRSCSGAVVLAVAGDAQAEPVAVEREARLGVADRDRGVVDARGTAGPRRLPARVALVGREPETSSDGRPGRGSRTPGCRPRSRFQSGSVCGSGEACATPCARSQAYARSMSLTMIATCWNQRSLLRESAGIGRPRGARYSASSSASSPSAAARPAARARTRRAGARRRRPRPRRPTPSEAEHAGVELAARDPCRRPSCRRSTADPGRWAVAGVPRADADQGGRARARAPRPTAVLAHRLTHGSPPPRPRAPSRSSR